MPSPYLKRDPGGGVACDCPRPARTTYMGRKTLAMVDFLAVCGGRGWSTVTVLAAVGLVGACGGNPVETHPGPNDECFGGFIGVILSSDTVAVGDSVHATARPVQSFASCFPGVTFVATWEAQPDSTVSISPTSDTTAWLRGVWPARVEIWARVRDAPSANGFTILVVAQ